MTDCDATRQAFERAATKHADKAKMDFTRLKGRDEYKYLRLEFMWLGWQLATEKARIEWDWPESRFEAWSDLTEDPDPLL